MKMGLKASALWHKAVQWIDQPGMSTQMAFQGLVWAAGIVGQSLLDDRRSLGLAGGLMVAGAILYALLMHARPSERARPDASSQPANPSVPLRTTYIFWALVLAALAFWGFGDNRITFQAVLPWGLSIAAVFVAFPPDPKPGQHHWTIRLREGLSRRSWRLSWTTIALLLAVLVSIWMRFYQLVDLPADLGWDLPYNYTDSNRIAEGEFLVFFPDNFGREGMFFYLIHAMAQVLGLSAYSIRVASAIAGVVAIPAIYMLTRECTDKHTAVVAAWLLAVNRWHVTLTRSGYRVSLMPLFGILALYGLARALRRQRPRDWAWWGLFLGLGLWTYKAFVFVLPTTIGCVVVYALFRLLARRWPLTDGSDWSLSPRRALRGVGLALLVTVIVAVPMIRFVVDYPDKYMARELHGAQLVTESLDSGLSRIKLYYDNAITSLLMFNYEGDGNSRFGVPYQRHLGYASAILFLYGLTCALGRFRHGANAMWVFAILGMMAPMTVSMLAGEKPNCFRSSGVIGPSLALSAIALVSTARQVARWADEQTQRSFVFQFSSGQTQRQVTLRPTLCLAALPFILATTVLAYEWHDTSQTYFHAFRQVAPDIENYSVALEMAKTMIAFDGPTYIKVWPHWYDGRAVCVHLGAAGRTWSDELFEIHPQKSPLAGYHGRMLILMHPQDTGSLQTLETFFPRHATLQEHYPNGQISFVAFYGER